MGPGSALGSLPRASALGAVTISPTRLSPPVARAPIASIDPTLHFPMERLARPPPSLCSLGGGMPPLVPRSSKRSRSRRAARWTR